MTIEKVINGEEIALVISGRVDSVTAPDLEAAVLAIADSAKGIIFDFKNLEYVSSAGLRVILLAQKKMNAVNGSFKIVNCGENIKEILEMTGFSSIITIE